ncbi:MAG: peptidylprolyl isomerase [Candidatus Gastranaerophilales bacterium]|nr:peptidylprolyl isomerase [Candidatus Gastranaerophilales bacterium]
MKKYILSVLLVGIMVIFSGCNLFGQKSANEIVITVNGGEITKKDIDTLIDRQMSSPLMAKVDKKSSEYKMMYLATKDKAVSEAIVRRLINDEIIKRNILVSPEEFQKYRQSMIDQVGGEENVKNILKQNNLTEDDFNAMADEDIKTNKLINSISPISVTEKDAEKFYQDNKASKFTHTEQVRASHLLIKEPKAGQMEKILEEAKAPNADFATIAKKYSEDPGSAANGGDLGFFQKDQMVKPFADAAFAMKPDTISDIIKTDYGYHIIKVTDRKKAGVTPYDEIKNEIKKYLEDQKKVEVIKKFIDGKMATTDVKYLDESYNPENIKAELQKLAPPLPQGLFDPSKAPKEEPPAETKGE